MPIVRNTIQRGPRNVVRRRIIVEFRNVIEGVVIEKREGGHVEELYRWLAENTSRLAGILLPKPEEDL